MSTSPTKPARKRDQDRFLWIVVWTEALQFPGISPKEHRNIHRTSPSDLHYSTQGLRSPFLPGHTPQAPTAGKTHTSLLSSPHFKTPAPTHQTPSSLQTPTSHPHSAEKPAKAAGNHPTRTKHYAAPHRPLYPTGSKTNRAGNAWARKRPSLPPPPHRRDR